MEDLLCAKQCVSIEKHQGESDGLVLGICLSEQTEARGDIGLLASLLFFSQESPVRGTGQTLRAKGMQACGHYPEDGGNWDPERVEQKCIYQSYAISQTPRKFWKCCRKKKKTFTSLLPPLPPPPPPLVNIRSMSCL